MAPATRALAAVLLSRIFGSGVTLAPDRFTGEASYAAALAAYQAEPPVRVLFDVGAGGAAKGAPIPGFSITAPSWPIPRTTPTTYYFGPGGTLTPQRPTATTTGAGTTGTAADRYDYDPAAFPATDAAGGSGASSGNGSAVAGFAPTYNWKPVPAGKALAYVSAPLTDNVVMAGTGSVDLWLRSTAPDVDLEVTISEVRPDGRETYIQSGWLRASQRKLDAAKSTAVLPVQTFKEADVAPLPKGRFTQVRVALYPFAHAFRAGSRIRIVVQPPGGNRPAWAFDALRYNHPVTNTIARSVAQPSKVVLPVVPGITVPTPLPACGASCGGNRAAPTSR